MSKQTDQELIRGAQGGDRTAFARLLEQHYDFMFKVAWQWSGAREDAEDIAQEAAMKLASHIGDFHFEAAFTTWLYKIVLNTARDYFRQKNKRDLREQPLSESEQYASLESSPEEKAIHKDVLKFIAELPEELREAVVLVCGQQMSHKEAGAVLRCPEGTVSWRIHEARKRLAACLDMTRKGKSYG
jgi:RNA polymerase sigma-70 factor (ECF subfamily)